MLRKCLQLKCQRQICKAQIFEDAVEVTTHELLQRHLVVLVPFCNVVQKARKSSLLNLLQLSLHFADIRGQLQF